MAVIVGRIMFVKTAYWMITSPSNRQIGFESRMLLLCVNLSEAYKGGQPEHARSLKVSKFFLLWGLCQPSDTPRLYWWMPARRSDREKIGGEQCNIF